MSDLIAVLLAFLFPGAPAPAAVPVATPPPPAIVTPATPEPSPRPTVRAPHVVNTPAPPAPVAVPPPAQDGVRTLSTPHCRPDDVRSITISGVSYPMCMVPPAEGATFTCITYNADGTWTYSEPTAPRVCPEGTFGSMVVQ